MPIIKNSKIKIIILLSVNFGIFRLELYYWSNKHWTILLVIVESVSVGVTDRRVHLIEFRSFNPLFEMDKV